MRVGKRISDFFESVGIDGRFVLLAMGCLLLVWGLRDLHRWDQLMEFQKRGVITRLIGATLLIIVSIFSLTWHQ